MSTVKITYKNKEYEFEKDIPMYEVAEKFKDDYKYKILAASIDKRLTGLNTKLKKDYYRFL